LLECKTFKDASTGLQRLMDVAARRAPRLAGPDERYVQLVPDLLAGVTAERLRDAMDRLAAPRVRTQVLLDHVAPVRASVTDAVQELLGILPRRGAMSFAQMSSGANTRLEVIVRFLAVLEMYKRGLVDLEQAASFAELHVRWLGDGGLGEGADVVEEYQG
jgi:segregation and condensation protein A